MNHRRKSVICIHNILLKYTAIFLTLSCLLFVSAFTSIKSASAQMPDHCYGTREQWEKDIERREENLVNSREAEMNMWRTTRGNFGAGRGKLPRLSLNLLEDPVMQAMVTLADERTSGWTLGQRADVFYAAEVGALNYEIDSWRQRDPDLPGGNARRAAEEQASEIPDIREYIRRCFRPIVWVKETVPATPSTKTGFPLEFDIYACSQPTNSWQGTVVVLTEDRDLTYDITFVPNIGHEVRWGIEPDYYVSDCGTYTEYWGLIWEYLVTYVDEDQPHLMFDGYLKFYFMIDDPGEVDSSFTVLIEFGEDERCPPP